MHRYGYSNGYNTGTGIQHFLKTYVGQYGYQVSGMVRVRVSDKDMWAKMEYPCILSHEWLKFPMSLETSDKIEYSSMALLFECE
jgi:hypothetical protein